MSSKAAFMGRNGVLNEVPAGGLINMGDFRLIQNAVKATNSLVGRGYFIAVVGNEKGEVPGMNYPQRLRLAERIIKDNVSGPVDFRYCIHPWRTKCECRLPKTGLLDWFVDEYDLDLSESIMFAGRDYEAVAAKSAGIGAVIRLSTGRGGWNGEVKDYPLYDSFLDAVSDFLE